ncbi:MAG TPA: hypothetical protein PLA65_11340 [Spirochaetota bacterium]|nr:hypothetical protein [Spirochaetota bacterium]HOD14058.1 hypothetical protein [Spirochaetota bacterium]HPN12650.1 hypothetical protein [Spirochaetota bacterium]
MKKLLLVPCAALIALALPAAALDTGGTAAATRDAKLPAKEEAARPAAEGGAVVREGDSGKKEEKSRNFNVDALILYGQYNRILWDAGITQSFDTFTYQLNSDFSRSNDYGYKNSRFYDNEIGFSGTADLSENWKFTPEAEVSNESHGMFRNPFYNREEKDRIILNIKNTYQPRPFRWDFNLSGIYFIHRFDTSLFPDVYTYRPYHSSDFYKAGAEIGWQYIISAANKVSFNSKFAQYFYSGPSDNDTYTANELIWNFNVGEYFKFGLGPLYAYNRDGGHFVSGRIEASTVNLKFVSVTASYLYDLTPFTPENYYFNQRYVRPYYSLSPGRGHHATLVVGVDANRTSDRPFYVKKVKCRATGTFLTSDRYYSFFSLPEQVLAPHQMKIAEAQAQGEAALGLAIYAAYVELGARYQYSYFYASDYVTYQPEHTAGGYVKLEVWRFETEFSTSYRGRMHSNPFMDVTMRPALIGSLHLQVKVYESFYLYGKIDNIYNGKFSTVYGYPEQGRTIIGGLRISI